MKIWHKQSEKDELQRLDNRKRFPTSGSYLLVLPENPTAEDLNFVQSKFNIHPISFQDYHYNSNPHVEDYGDYFFITCFILDYSGISKRFGKIKVGLCFGENFVLLLLNDKHQRIQTLFNNETYISKIMEQSSVYVVLKIINALFETYISALSQFYPEIDEIEKKINQMNGNDSTLHEIIQCRRLISFAYRTTLPHREVLSAISDYASLREEDANLAKEVNYKLNNVMQTISVYREMVVNSQDSYISLTTHKLYKIMRKIALSIFLLAPFLLVSSIYGMSSRLSETESTLSFHVVLFVLLGISLLTILFRKRFFK